MTRQLEVLLRSAIREGRLRAGSSLPSSRTLAEEIGVSRGLVVEAYEQLAAEGYLVSRPGAATRVVRTAARRGVRVAPSAPVEYDFEFRPGRPDLTAFPREAWLRSLRHALALVPASRLGYLDGRGMPELRVALADYLNRVRGTVAQPDDVVITVGYSQGLALVASILRAGGLRRFAVEQPSHVEFREVLETEGLQTVEIPVDREGLRVDLLTRARVGGVLTTPAHQYPTGAVLSADRRKALLAWADRRDALVIEDDYDAEFRYDRAPIGALQGLRPERVVYAGSASKVLAPGLRLGWFIAPSALADEMAALKKASDQGSPALDQLAFADFVARGELDRHLRRMRPIYHRRRDRLVEALARHLPELAPVGAAAGLHVLAWLEPGLDPVSIVEAADRASIGLASVPATDARGGGLIFGYGAIPDRDIEPGIRRLAGVVHEARKLFGAAPEGAAPMLSR
ncbi:MAG TPA: PLP-dependent aminotransferase family protein [Candidatus Limnocylindrales bacterium]|nr:PLP-dependent aminotransferase family protein [Candidatus Limnocylindrales bacterium]